MTIAFGSRGREAGDRYLIASVAPSGTNGGTVTLVDPLQATVAASMPFVVNAMAYNGGAAALANFLAIRVLNTLTAMFGLGTSIDSASKTFNNDRGAGTGTFFQTLWSLAGRKWFGITHRTVGGVEKLRVAAFPDGTSEAGGLEIDGATGKVSFPAGVTGTPSFDAVIATGGGGLASVAPNPIMKFQSTSAGTDLKDYDMIVAPDGVFYLRAVNDAYTTAGAVFSVTRTNTAPTSIRASVPILPDVADGRTVGSATARFYQTWATEHHVDTYFSSYLSGGNPYIAFDANDSLYYIRGANFWVFSINGSNRLSIGYDYFNPSSDLGMYLGHPTGRWAGIYAGSGTINTSDANDKTPKRAFTDEELDAWGEVSGGAFQFLDVVAHKGEDGARVHYGYIAQEIHSAFAARGIDAGRLALWCADEKMRVVTTTKTETRQKVETVSVEEPYVQVLESGRAVQSTRMVPVERPVMRRVPLFDGAGLRVMHVFPDPADPEKTIHVEAFHEEPVMEEFQVASEEREPTGEYRYGLRYDGCHVIEAAYQRRRADRIEARLAALEAHPAA